MLTKINLFASLSYSSLLLCQGQGSTCTTYGKYLRETGGQPEIFQGRGGFAEFGALLQKSFKTQEKRARRENCFS